MCLFHLDNHLSLRLCTILARQAGMEWRMENVYKTDNNGTGWWCGAAGEDDNDDEEVEENQEQLYS